MKAIRIAISGGSPYNGNKGVGALVVSALYLIDEMAKLRDIDIEIYLINSEYENKSIDNIEIIDRVIKVENIHPLLFNRARSLIRFLVSPKLWPLLVKYNSFNCFLNIGLGDSFSDIYGIQRFKDVDSYNYLARLFNKKYALMPQTIGPFKSDNVKKKAKISIKKAFVVFARDRASYVFTNNLVKHNNLIETVDMAFFMPYEKQSFDKKYVHIGLNVSGLLWNGGYSQENQFGLKSNYKTLTYKIIEYLLSLSLPAVIHLVPHVVSDRDHIENDYFVSCKLLHSFKKDNIVLSPFFFTPMDAKNYISGLDFFIGARMHSTIAAFSSYTPVFPLAYSRKFNGLFIDTLKYKYIGDMVNYSADEIVEKLKVAFENRNKLREVIYKQMTSVVAQQKNLIEQNLYNFIKTVCNEHC